ncbi:uncharacterized protein LOC135473231 [Liolophura sinensis]|uniref:uncharacterized protein LOC135473231 n=1 Tax=Liolophura sinensis TaxID=3198878 RepID=UPI003158BC69
MEDKTLDDYRPTETDGPYPVKEEIFTSPLSCTDTAVWDASFNETDFTDDSINVSWDEEKKRNMITAHFRANLVSWLSTVNGYFQFAQDTLFLAVNIVDRCLQRMDVTRGSFQLLGATAFLIAGKHEEVTPPEINDLLWLCAEAYSRNQMVKMEELILDAIHFEMFVPTGSFFLEYFACCEMMDSDTRNLDEFRNARRHARYFMELSLQDYKLSQYLPSMLALCAWKWAVQDCMAEYRLYSPSWEVDFNPAAYKNCFEDFLVFVSKLKGTVSEANVLTGCYDHDDDSDVECLNSY